MANGGWHGSAEEWARLESPLLQVDPILSAFAKEFGLTVTKNFKDWPERSVVWGKTVRLLIQLYLADAKTLSFNLWLSASHVEGTGRFWKHATPIKGKTMPEFQDELPELLRSGREQLVSWGKSVG